ncbi:MAG: hypothetical protein ACLURV_09375 [Gallintestinimicrobium sp.]
MGRVNYGPYLNWQKRYRRLRYD